jgi:hypothetical protein
MKLYKLSVILGDSTIDRGVWADNLSIQESTFIFRDEEQNVVSVFPVNRTFITSIETQEQVEERKRAREESLASIVSDRYPKK